MPYATAAQGHGVGPYWTMAYNSGRRREGPITNTFGDGCGGGTICIEMTDQEGHSSDYPNYFGNFLVGVRGGVLDSCDHNDDRNPDCNAEMPYQLLGMDWKRNLTLEDVSRAFAVGSNRTSDNRDALTSGPSLHRPVEWYLSHARMPSSFAYDRELERDPFFTPHWWCRESVAFEKGLLEDRTPGARRGKLPAQIRAEGGTCTTGWRRFW